MYFNNYKYISMVLAGFYKLKLILDNIFNILKLFIKNIKLIISFITVYISIIINFTSNYNLLKKYL